MSELSTKEIEKMVWARRLPDAIQLPPGKKLSELSTDEIAKMGRRCPEAERLNKYNGGKKECL